MERRHIAVFTPLVAGHVYPALGLCSELVRRGHRVTYPTDERFFVRVRETGAEPIGCKLPEARHVEKVVQNDWPDDDRHWRAFISVRAPMLLATAAVMVTEVRGFYAENPPDVILYDWFAFAGRILARLADRPAIQVCTHFAHRDYLVRINGVYTTPKPMLAFAHSLDSFMATYGFEGVGHFWHAEKLNIFFIPREFQPDAELFDDRFMFVGASLDRKPRASVWRNEIGKGRPLLLISENTASKDDAFLSLCIEAFADSRYHVVFSKGLHSPEISSVLPHNFEINREALNREILPFANVLLCQGGMGTVMESLHYGVPVVAVAASLWNSEVAYRTDELGLGFDVPVLTVTSGALREAVDSASSDEAMHSRVRRMQETMRRYSAAETAADAIEESLVKRVP